MADDTLQQLEERLAQTERKDLVVALAEARQKMKSEPSQRTIDTYKAIRRALAELDAEAEEPKGECFDNISQVGDYLTPEWSVTKKTLYEHEKKGRIRSRDGKYWQSDIEAYAVAFLKRRDGSYEKSVIQELQEESTKADLKYKKARAQAAEYKNRLQHGEFVERQLVEEGLAARAQRLRAGLLRWISTSAPELVRTVNGDEQRIPDAIAQMREIALRLLNEYSQPTGWEWEDGD